MTQRDRWRERERKRERERERREEREGAKILPCVNNPFKYILYDAIT